MAEGVTAPVLGGNPEGSDSAEEGEGEAGVPVPWPDGVTCPGSVFCPDGVVCPDGVTCPVGVLLLDATVAFVSLISLLSLLAMSSGRTDSSEKETALSLRFRFIDTAGGDGDEITLAKPSSEWFSSRASKQ